MASADVLLPMSAIADATHFSGCLGEILLDGCHMEGQGDDGINVHGIFHDVRSGLIRLTKRRITMLIGAKPLGGRQSSGLARSKVSSYIE